MIAGKITITIEVPGLYPDTKQMDKFEEEFDDFFNRIERAVTLLKKPKWKVTVTDIN